MAGRHVDVDPVASMGLRNMMACTITGQGAGVGAAVSLKTGQHVGKVTMRLVQDELRRQGVSIHKSEAIKKMNK